MDPIELSGIAADYELSPGPAPNGFVEVGEAAVRSALLELLGNPRNVERLQRATEHASWRRESAPLEELSFALAAGALKLYRRVPFAATDRLTPHEPEEDAVPLADLAPPEQDWIELELIDAESGCPVEGVTLTVTLPCGTERSCRSDADGLIAVRGVERGVCHATSQANDAGLEHIVVYDGFGRTAVPANEAPADSNGADRPLARLDAYEMRDGDTLAAVAESAGLRWQQLAEFNFGTDDKELVTEHLRYDIGCELVESPTDAMSFADGEQPGPLFVPRFWSAAQLATGVRHVIRVRPPPLFDVWEYSV